MNPAILPSAKAHEQYNEYFTIYKELYPVLKETMSKRADILK